MGRLRGANAPLFFLPPSFSKGRGIKGDGFYHGEKGGEYRKSTISKQNHIVIYGYSVVLSYIRSDYGKS
jgi:hypothetical protein